MQQRIITGKIRHIDLATGFWCIVDSRYRKWRIVDAPSALQREHLHVKATVAIVEEGASIFMSGTPVKVLSFEVIS